MRYPLHRCVSKRTVPAMDSREPAGVSMDGSEIRRRRKLKGLAVYDLARLCDITPGYLSLIELGQRSPSAPVFARICDGLGIAETDRAQLLKVAS
jgi:transcriptional regulator with XRE-family HTH domain